jgi:hypothetical protein
MGDAGCGGRTGECRDDPVTVDRRRFVILERSIRVEIGVELVDRQDIAEISLVVLEYDRDV